MLNYEKHFLISLNFFLIDALPSFISYVRIKSDQLWLISIYVNILTSCLIVRAKTFVKVVTE